MSQTTPTLHCGFEYVPSDGSGRFYAGADKLFHGTGMLGAHWKAHIATRLFHRDLRDRLLPMTFDTVAEIDREVTSVANEMLDHWQARFGRNAPDGPLRVFVDLEEQHLKREPYTDPDYGPASQEMMGYLCGALELCGQERGWTVLASMYRPLRQLGLGHARTGKGPDEAFVAIWGGQAVKSLLWRSILWAHLCYMPQDPDRLRGATHLEYAERQACYTMAQVLDAGAEPKEIWWAVWLSDEVRTESMRGIFEGLQAALSGSEAAKLDATHHVLVCGEWALLRGLTSKRVEPVFGPDGRHARPLRLTIPSFKTGPWVAQAWNKSVSKPFYEVFAPEAVSA